MLRQLTTLVLGACLGAVPLGAQASTQLTAASGAASLRGTAFDSLHMRPLAGASIEAVAAQDVLKTWRTTTDSVGAWRLDGLPAAEYLVALSHPMLDSLAIELALVRVTATAVNDRAVALAIPGARTVVAQSCPTVPDSMGLFVAVIRGATGGGVMAGATVVAQWNDIRKVNGSLRLSSPAVAAQTDAEGHVMLCGLPRERPVQVRAWRGADSTGVVTLDVPPDGILRHELYVAPSAPAGHSITGSVRGIDGRGIGGAVVAMAGVGTMTTGPDGAFAFSNAPLGSRMMDVRAIGHESQHAVVHLLEDQPTALRVLLYKAGTSLSKVKVVGATTGPDGRMKEFEKHRQSGLGVFIDEKMITERNSSALSDYVRVVPGIISKVSARSVGTDSLVMRGMGVSGECSPIVYVDGTRLENTSSLDRVVTMADVIGIEVYTRISDIPLEFQTRSHCGVIAVWTGRRRPHS